MRRYVIPSADREIFINPPINHIVDLIHSNTHKFSTYNFSICGIPFQKFRSTVRNEILQKAIEYTKQITPVLQNNSAIRNPQSAIIQTGYQPTFYYPGIWIKNHLAYHIAKRVDGLSINISIDNDTCHENWICVPTPTLPSPLEGEDKVGGQEITLEKIEFVERSANLAFEELSFTDTSRVIHFRDKALACLNRLALSEANVSVSGGSKTFEKFVNLMIDASKKTSNVGEILTIARRKFEDSFGIHNLEVPVSKICECDSFLIFFLTILLDCKRFASIYNYRLGCYRKEHKLRSKASALGGLPDLKVDGNTVEIPFWAWRQGEPRKRLFAQCVDNRHINLIYENETISTFAPSPYPSPSRGEGRVGVWRLDAHLTKLKELFNSGIKIRPRAITNTMFSRLFFSDLFIHGIGGARYDVITDSLIKDFFEIEPPNFLTVSATLHLPFQTFDITLADLNTRRLLLRDMHYNPDKHLPAYLKTDKEINMLIMEKQKIIETTDIQNHAERLHKFKRIREINNILKDKLLPYLQQEKTELERMEKIVLQNKIMRNRVYPFCIYPESLLKDFCGKHSLLPGW